MVTAGALFVEDRGRRRRALAPRALDERELVLYARRRQLGGVESEEEPEEGAQARAGGRVAAKKLLLGREDLDLGAEIRQETRQRRADRLGEVAPPDHGPDARRQAFERRVERGRVVRRRHRRLRKQGGSVGKGVSRARARGTRARRTRIAAWCASLVAAYASTSLSASGSAARNAYRSVSGFSSRTSASTIPTLVSPLRLKYWPMAGDPDPATRGGPGDRRSPTNTGGPPVFG